MIFSKEEKTIVSYWRFLHETKENPSQVFQVATISFLGIHSQAQ